MSRFSGRSAARKSAAVRRKRLLAQAFCRHLIQHEGASAPSHSLCKTESIYFRHRFFDKLMRERFRSRIFIQLPGVRISSTLSFSTS